MKEPRLVRRVNHEGAHLPGAVSLSPSASSFYSAVFIALDFSCSFVR